MMSRTIRWRRNLWNVLGSRRLAVVLLGALPVVLLLIGLFPHMPAELDSREQWLEAARLRYGPATATLRRLGVFEAHRSSWFVALLAGLLLNTLVCTIQRLRQLRRSWDEPVVIHRPEAFFQASAFRAQWRLDDVERGIAALKDTLDQRGYRPRVEEDNVDRCVGLYAERGRWSQLGTILSHLATVVLFCALAYGPTLPEGRNPAFFIAVSSAVLLLFGSVISLWVPHRRLWLRVDSRGNAQLAGVGDWGRAFDAMAIEMSSGCRAQGEIGG
jgi:cytochrome c biogenesis protein ResB